MKIYLTVLISFFSISLFAKEGTAEGRKVIYTYKQFEKFDFDDLNIEADSGSPNDLSVTPIHEKRYSNRLPYRKSFTAEIRKGIERVR
jgi:hypothetical protein